MTAQRRPCPLAEGVLKRPGPVLLAFALPLLMGLAPPADERTALGRIRVGGAHNFSTMAIPSAEPGAANSSESLPSAEGREAGDWANAPPFGEERMEVALNVDLTVTRSLCLDLNLVTGLDDDRCDWAGHALDDRVHRLSPFAGLGLRVTVFPFRFSSRMADSRLKNLGFHLEYAHSLVVLTRHQYRADPDGQPTPYTVDTSQQDLKAAVIGQIPLGARPGWHLRLSLGVGWYQVSLDQTDYPHDLDLVPADRGLNPYLPTYSYLTVDTGLRLQLALRRVVVPFLSVLARYSVDQVGFNNLRHYPLSQASRVYGIRNQIIGLEGELGLVFRLPRRFALGTSAQVMWFHTVYSVDNKHRLRGQEEQLIWGNGLVFGNSSDDLLVRVRLTLSWAF